MRYTYFPKQESRISRTLKKCESNANLVLYMQKDLERTMVIYCRLKSKGHGKLSIHFCVDLETIETIFRIIISVNQLSLYGAVAEMCEEYKTLHDYERDNPLWEDNRVPHSCQT